MKNYRKDDIILDLYSFRSIKQASMFPIVKSLVQRLKECIPPSTRGRLKHKYLCKWYGTAWNYALRRRKYRMVLRKPVINVVFQVENMGKWKCQSVLDEMRKNPRFKASIWYVADAGVTEEMIIQHERMVDEFFARQGVRVLHYPNLKAFPTQEKPDMIFVCEPYIHVLKMPHNEGLLDYLVLYVPYCFRNTLRTDPLNTIITHAALFNFYENDYIASLGGKCMRSGMRNIRVTGHPIGDAFLYPRDTCQQVWKCPLPTMKKVIWAPHWTIDRDCFFGASTFLQVAEHMLKIAKQYEDKIQFAFKPHPTLYKKLCEHSDWGQERTDAYYQQWQDMPNTQLELGAYTDLFLQSDAMIHDCGSFSVEYLYTDKPCMFLMEKEMRNLNRMTSDALNCHVKGISAEDICRFLNEEVLHGRDTMKRKRAEYRVQYLLTNGHSAAQNIVETILTDSAV